MNFLRRLTKADFDPRKDIPWKTVKVGIKNDSGRVVLADAEIEVPEFWSQSATDILAHKYLRKAGVPSHTVALSRDPAVPFVVPAWLAPSIPADNAIFGPELSAFQAFHRLAGHWTYAAYAEMYFQYDEDYRNFYNELFYMLAHQIFSPNSPQWFNTGLWWAYGINDSISAPGYRAPVIGEPAVETNDAYTFPQTAACFILGIKDSLLGRDGIMDTLTKEARIFKYGSGSGINYSNLRAKGSPLHNGGTSSGLLSFLNVFDANAGTIKSGGTTRRAARMVVVDADHPEALDVARWKVKEELKVHAMANGARNLAPTTPYARDVLNSLTPTYESEAYHTVGGQNANNSIRATHAFMQCATASNDDPRETQYERNLFDTICEAAWAVGDPGMQFHDTCNKWHTIPKVAPQVATNPCSEFSFIDNSSCNLAALNLLKFRQSDNSFDIELFSRCVETVTMVLDATISMSSFPTKEIAENTTNYRPLGLGFANLGGLLMASGVPYDSAQGRTYAAAITSLMTAQAWATSAKLAHRIEPFHDYPTHADDVKCVLELHVSANAQLKSSVNLSFTQGINVNAIYTSASMLWAQLITDNAPVRNAQLTLLAPTGTTALAMDCATTGIEPDFALVKLKKLAGGGTMNLINQLVRTALETLGYEEGKIRQIESSVKNFGTIDKTTPHVQISDIPVFACANDINYNGHLGMMAAVQPFLSGAISKTVNLPNSATVADVRNVFLSAWRLGLKAVAVYRDGCKLAQPLIAKGQTDTPAQALIRSIAPDDTVSQTDLPPLPKLPDVAAHAPKNEAVRYYLPHRRQGFTQKVTISGHKLYMRTGEYKDGRVGELFVTISKEGSTLKHLMDSLAIAISIGLQYGVPLQEYVDAFSDSKSEPSGLVQGSDNVKFCSSLMDYVVRELAASYINKPAPDNAESSEDPIELSPMPMPRITSNGSLRTMTKSPFMGDSCSSCGSFTLRRNGTCLVCETCGQTTGCS